jgi:hypothetical protein
MRFKRLLVGGAAALMLGAGLIGTGQSAFAHGPEPTATPSPRSDRPLDCKPAPRSDDQPGCPPAAPRPRPADPRYTG